MSLYNMVNGVNPATFYVLPMLGRHPDEYPRFRDCHINKEKQIEVLTRVGGGNRNEGYGEEELYKDPNFVKTFDADWDSTYGIYVFNVPEQWKDDFERILKGERLSDAYIDQMCKVYPKLEEEFRHMYDEVKEEQNAE